MELSGHVLVWGSALAVVTFASPFVRAYAEHRERRLRARSAAVVARVLASSGAARGATPETGHDEESATRSS
jgi:hypothetical protein